MQRRIWAGAALLAALAPQPAWTAVPAVTNVAAREVTVLNDPKGFAAGTSATAREVVALNDPKAFAAGAGATAREVVALNDPKAFAQVLNVLAREVTVQAGAVPQLAKAKTALILTGGLAVATSSDLSALNVVTIPPSAHTVDLLDAVRLARKAAGLDP